MVDKLIANGKKIFIKSPLRVQKFKEEAPTLPLPPQPVVTRCGTWFDAANYYCTNYSQIEKIFSKLTEKIHLLSNLYSSCFLKLCVYQPGVFSKLNKIALISQTHLLLL